MYWLILFNFLVMCAIISFYLKQYEIMGLLLIILYSLWSKNKKEYLFSKKNNYKIKIE